MGLVGRGSVGPQMPGGCPGWPPPPPEPDNGVMRARNGAFMGASWPFGSVDVRARLDGVLPESAGLDETFQYATQQRHGVVHGGVIVDHARALVGPDVMQAENKSLTGEALADVLRALDQRLIVLVLCRRSRVSVLTHAGIVLGVIHQRSTGKNIFSNVSRS